MPYIVLIGGLNSIKSFIDVEVSCHVDNVYSSYILASRPSPCTFFRDPWWNEDPLYCPDPFQRKSCDKPFIYMQYEIVSLGKKIVYNKK